VSRRVSVGLRLREDGAVIIDQSLDDHTRERRGFGFDSQIEQKVIAEAVRSGLSFVNALYEQRDPGHRYATFLYGAAVSGMSMRVVVEEFRVQESWSFPMEDRGWHVLDKPRRLDRTDLSRPAAIVDRTTAFIVKRYGHRR